VAQQRLQQLAVLIQYSGALQHQQRLPRLHLPRWAWWGIASILSSVMLWLMQLLSKGYGH